MSLKKRLVSAYLMLVLILSTCFIPLNFGAEAAPAVTVTENVTEVFTFDNCASSTESKALFTAEGVGYYGWAGYAGTNGDGNSVFIAKDTTKNTWLTKGGFRLNKKVGDSYSVYNLEPSSTYVISLEFRVLSGSKQVGNTVNSASSGLRFSYGALHTTAYDATNQLNSKKADVEYILSSAQNSTTYTVSTEEGKIEYPYGEEWHSTVYSFTTPADMGSGDNSLLIWSEVYSGFHCEIDNVSVTKLSEDMGFVVFNDEYSGKSDVAFGKIGSQIVLPDVSDRANAATHTFEGWCKDAARTENVKSVSVTASKQIFYSKWKSPVTVTFKDTYNNTETKVSGNPGDKVNFPADPTDKENKQWFMGWYTNENYTSEYTGATFGYSNITVYSLWKSSVPGLNQNFENYTKDSYTVTVNSSGRKMRSNFAYFGVGMSKQSAVTFGESKYAIKIDWDAQMKVDNNNELSYDSSRYFHYQDNAIWLGKGLEHNQAYVAKFMLNIEKADTDLRFCVFSAGEANTWQDSTPSAVVTVSKNKAGSGWFEVEIPFETDFSKNMQWSNTMYLAHMPLKNEDFVAFVDDVKIEAFAQPYESLVSIETNYGADKVLIKGKRGDKIDLPTLTHPDGAKFLGYYLDKAFTEEFTRETFGRGNITIYAKWAKAPMSFREYPYKDSNKSFGQTMSIVNEKGVGVNDDYALKFGFKGDDIYQTKEDGTVVYMNTRASQQEHVACIGMIEPGKLYKLSFNYKTGAGSNSNYKMQVVYGSDNIWDTYARKLLGNTIVMSAEETEWQTYEITFIANPLSVAYGKNLYVQFFSSSVALETVVNAYVDNVMLEKIEGDIVYITGNGAKDVAVIGKAGDPFKIPAEFKNGRAELLGLYTDKDLKAEFTETTIPAGVTVVYASWSTAPITFEEQYYPFDTTKGTGFGYTTNMVNEKGIGIDDDWAMRFNLDADAVYNENATGNNKYWLSRVSQRDHVFPVAKLKDGAIYRLTYNYRFANDQDVSVTITPVSGHYNNVWENSVFTSYDAAMVTTSKKDSQWQTYSTYISAKVPDVTWTKGDTLFLMLRVNGATMDTYTDVLIDNVLVEEIKAPYIFFDTQNGVVGDPVQGKAGEEIVFPANPTRHGYTFKGWFLDKAAKTPFTDKTFTQGKGITVYAGWSKHSTIKYDFENFGIKTYEESGKYHLGDAVLYNFSGAHSGKNVIKYDRTGEYNITASYHPFAANGEIFKMDLGKKYAVSVHYYVAKRPSASFGLSVYAGAENNFWDGWKDVGGGIVTTLKTAELNVWKNATFIVDSKDVVDRQSYLFFRFTGGKDGIFYIDDITITEIPAGSVAVTVSNDGGKSIPEILIGKTGQSFASKLPEAPQRKGKFFTGYYTLDANGSYVALEKEKMLFDKQNYKVYARYIDYEMKQSFEEDYIETFEKSTAFSIFDFDYEVYDGAAEGNSKDNVTDGRYSLHRKGTSPYFENAIILTTFKEIADNQRYTITMKVKMGKYYQTDGAVKIASGRSPGYAWTTGGSYYPIIPIADLTDGQWHSVSFTFNSVERYLSLQTPGYCELFIDDITLTLVEDKDKTPVSTPVEFTEYVPAMRDSEGNLVEKNFVVDVSTIIAPQVKKSSFNLMYVIIPAGAVLIIAAASIILFKKKKNKKA